MKKISKIILEGVVKDSDAIKALALCVLIKNTYANSVVYNFSYYKISKIANIHQASAKKYIKKLEKMGLVERDGKYNQHLRFKRVYKRFNLSISKIDTSTLKNIEMGLKATILVFLQQKKDYIHHQTFKATNDSWVQSKADAKERKSIIKKLLEERWIDDISNGRNKVEYKSNFVDNGFSFNYLSSFFKMGKSTISQMLDYAVKNKMIAITKHCEQVFLQNAKEVFKFNSEKIYTDSNGVSKKYAFCTKNNIYFVKANTFKVI